MTFVATCVAWLVEHRLVAALMTCVLMGAGAYVSPFEIDGLEGLPRDPVPVDALPDLGDNQQIIFTEWPGRSPQDIEDQITYPLTGALMGIPGVRTVRSASAFGFSSVYVIFDDDVEFYWSRARVLEKLSALPAGTLPQGVTPTLGPDATALGQVFWYTLEGRDPEGRVVGGFDQDELRAAQDWTIRYALQGVEGVSEVASVGGFVREYQVNLDPEALAAAGVTLGRVAQAIRGANLDVGARTMEINGAEYLIRGVGLLRGIEDLERTVVSARALTPIRIQDVGQVVEGPALRRGALDDAGAPAVGGVVVARFGANPRAVIEGVKAQIERISAGLPRRTLEDGTISQMTIVPFYDRSALIDETLGTLSTALFQQIVITVVVVVMLLGGLGASLLISLMVPLAVVGTLVVMRVTGVEANIMALGGVAIAIGTMVDVSIVFTENIQRHLDDTSNPSGRGQAIAAAMGEVAPAVLISVLTTVVGFLPVFGLTESELRLFGPLAVTKTVAMLVALALALTILPGFAAYALHRRQRLDMGLRVLKGALIVALVGGLLIVLAKDWRPLEAGLLLDALFVGGLVVGVLLAFRLFLVGYPVMLGWILRHKVVSLIVPAAIVGFGAHAWSTLGKAHMPPFDEGAFLYMATTMPHASIGEVAQMLSNIDAAIEAIPEVDRVVGKLGRVESPLDPAPVSMIETVITYVPEYVTEEGVTRRQWRPHIKSPDDIWAEIVRAAEHPGLTGAPQLMPISARQVMLQSGMRSPLGVKITGPDLKTIEAFGVQLESLLKSSPAVAAPTVFAERIVGKPYLEVRIDREAIGRHGLTVAQVQETLQMALGGATLTRAVQGRARFDVRLRYMPESRGSIEALERVLIHTSAGAAIPLQQLAEVAYVKGPQMIKSEDTFLVGYVLFDAAPGVGRIDAVEQVKAHIQAQIDSGLLKVPEGVSHTFAGTYANYVESEQRMMWLLPLTLIVVFMLLYVQSGQVTTALMVFSGVAVAMAGGFAMLWLYNQPGALDFTVAGVSMSEVFRVGPVQISMAVWVGFIALIGIATDDGVVMSTYLNQSFEDRPPETVEAIRSRTLEAGCRRVRPCLMTTATTLLALLPVITARGRGADVMMPMALPMVGGMLVELITLFVVPVLYCARAEWRLWWRQIFSS
ncbi:MAG: efflux RND transporter permease subunit [Bradymonadia bacterium]